MSEYRPQITRLAKHIKNFLTEAVKVLSSMVLVFLVLVVTGPLTYAIPQIGHLF